MGGRGRRQPAPGGADLDRGTPGRPAGQLIPAGIGAVRDQGYANTPVKAICEGKQGLTERYFYEAFGDRESLLDEIYSHGCWPVPAGDGGKRSTAPRMTSKPRCGPGSPLSAHEWIRDHRGGPHPEIGWSGSAQMERASAGTSIHAFCRDRSTARFSWAAGNSSGVAA